MRGYLVPLLLVPFLLILLSNTAHATDEVVYATSVNNSVWNSQFGELNSTYGTRFTTGAIANITKISIRSSVCGGNNGNCTGTAIAYADIYDMSCNLIGRSIDTTFTGGGGWYDFTFTNGGLELLANTNYIVYLRKVSGDNVGICASGGYGGEWTQREPAQSCANLSEYQAGATSVSSDSEWTSDPGLSFTSIEYNPVTGNVFLAGTCTKYGSGFYQMDLNASINFDPETLEYDRVDPESARGSLVNCLDGTFTALYNGAGLTGTTTVILDDRFYGTQLITTEVNFYEVTGSISYNWGDLISIDTRNASGTVVSIPFIYNVCGDPDYSATSSYIYLASNQSIDGQEIHILDNTSPKVQISECSGASSISFNMPYNNNYEGEAYFAYADVYNIIILKSKPFYVFAHPKALKNGETIYFTDTTLPDDSCTPPDYNIANICAGIPDTVLGNTQCGFKYGLVSAGQFLFLPSCSSRAFITQQFYKFKKAFPFSVFYDLTETIDTAVMSAQNSTSTTSGIAIPFIRKTATSTEYFMMPIATSTSFSNFIGVTNYNTYLTTLAFVWWIIVGGVIFFIIWKV